MNLSFSGVSVTRGGRPILSAINFTAPKGAITGLLGPNGAGKSTLLHTLIGLVPASGGAVFDGLDLLSMPRRERARTTALVEQSVSTEERLSVRDVVALGRIPYQSALSGGDDRAGSEIVDQALAEVGMEAFADRRIQSLSGGEQQRVHIARALAQEPRLLLLDEPTSHLDIRAQLELTALLRRKADSGMTVLVAVHDLNLAARCCDHLMVLDKGHLYAEGAPKDVLTAPMLEAVYGVRARLLDDPQSGRATIIYDEPAS